MGYIANKKSSNNIFFIVLRFIRVIYCIESTLLHETFISENYLIVTTKDIKERLNVTLNETFNNIVRCFNESNILVYEIPDKLLHRIGTIQYSEKQFFRSKDWNGLASLWAKYYMSKKTFFFLSYKYIPYGFTWKKYQILYNYDIDRSSFVVKDSKNFIRFIKVELYLSKSTFIICKQPKVLMRRVILSKEKSKIIKNLYKEKLKIIKEFLNPFKYGWINSNPTIKHLFLAFSKQNNMFLYPDCLQKLFNMNNELNVYIQKFISMPLIISKERNPHYSFKIKKFQCNEEKAEWDVRINNIFNFFVDNEKDTIERSFLIFEHCSKVNTNLMFVKYFNVAFYFIIRNFYFNKTLIISYVFDVINKNSNKEIKYTNYGCAFDRIELLFILLFDFIAFTQELVIILELDHLFENKQKHKIYFTRVTHRFCNNDSISEKIMEKIDNFLKESFINDDDDSYKIQNNTSQYLLKNIKLPNYFYKSISSFIIGLSLLLKKICHHCIHIQSNICKNLISQHIESLSYEMFDTSEFLHCFEIFKNLQANIDIIFRMNGKIFGSVEVDLNAKKISGLINAIQNMIEKIQKNRKNIYFDNISSGLRVFDFKDTHYTFASVFYGIINTFIIKYIYYYRYIYLLFNQTCYVCTLKTVNEMRVQIINEKINLIINFMQSIVSLKLEESSENLDSFYKLLCLHIDVEYDIEEFKITKCENRCFEKAKCIRI